MTRFQIEKDGGAAYLQLCRQLKERLAAGVYPV